MRYIRRVLFCASLGLGLPLSISQAEEARTGVVGTWLLTGYTQQFLDTKEIVQPFGDHPTGYIQYSAGGHVVDFLAQGDMPIPAASAYTDAERAAIHRGILGAYAGSYRVEGNKITHRVLTSWRPEWNGTDLVRFYDVQGDKLTITTAPTKFSRTGQDFVATLTFKRVE